MRSGKSRALLGFTIFRARSALAMVERQHVAIAHRGVYLDETDTPGSLVIGKRKKLSILTLFLTAGFMSMDGDVESRSRCMIVPALRPNQPHLKHRIPMTMFTFCQTLLNDRCLWPW
jgi:hypothetical protein